MITLNFEEQGMSFPVNYTLLKVIAENIPDDERYEKLVDALLALDISSINAAIASSFCNNLDQDRYDILWNTGDIMVREAFLHDKSSFCHRLTDERAHALMKEDNKKALICIGKNSEKLFPVYIDDTDIVDDIDIPNISESVARELVLFIKKHHDPEVRDALACNYGTPDEFRMSFAEFLEAGLYDYASHALSTITTDDVENLKKMNDLDLAIKVAENLGVAGKTIKIRKDLAKWLLDYPDPAVRIAMAENTGTPEAVLRDLLEDPELDVVQTARDSLAKRDGGINGETALEYIPKLSKNIYYRWYECADYHIYLSFNPFVSRKLLEENGIEDDRIVVPNMWNSKLIFYVGDDDHTILICKFMKAEGKPGKRVDIPIRNFWEFSQKVAPYFDMEPRFIRRICCLAGLHEGEQEAWFDDIVSSCGFGGEIFLEDAEDFLEVFKENPETGLVAVYINIGLDDIDDEGCFEAYEDGSTEMGILVRPES